ncbi:response regulator transcription factor [Streptosporangium sp. CA-135522]|uniref:response regulator transcription factor n=1 Tax=Streptosporangium sp. CA-135522 TaxID=3240072 RepID=UPI003D8AF834
MLRPAGAGPCSARATASHGLGHLADLLGDAAFYDHLALPLPAPSGTMRAFALGREDGTFTKQEREFVERLHPVLITMDHKARLSRSPAAQSRLTPREEQVLELIAAGLPRQIAARRLRISIRTVDKYLEAVYRKLGVSSHIQAALWLNASRAGKESRPPASPPPL